MYPVTPWSRLKFFGWNLNLGSKYFSVYFYTGILSDYCKFACTKLRYCHWGELLCRIREISSGYLRDLPLGVKSTPAIAQSDCQTEMLRLLSVCRIKRFARGRDAD